MSAILDSRVLRARKPVQVVMLHGLFSNGAFWIPYLGSFEDFQVMLISVDYGAVLRASGSLDALAEHIDGLVGSKPAHLIGHSFGCWLGLRLKSDFISRSFICPTFAALEFCASSFCDEIDKRTALERAEVERLVSFAVGYKTRHVDDMVFHSDDRFFLPRDDPYFQYIERLPVGKTCSYQGGHFDVSKAVASISCHLTAYGGDAFSALSSRDY